jgi:argininosuccinate lyase
MIDTGRIARPLTATARRIAFGAVADAAIDAELMVATEVDRAHLVVLAEERLVPATAARRLLDEIEALRARNFAPLRGRAAARGLYLHYEDHLIATLGADTGGLVQLGRSRNDAGATALRLRLRAPYRRLLGEALRLEAVLLRRARRFAAVVMPAYTHYQPAVPVTYGHYLAGVACAVGRDADALLAAGADLDRCPLGAGAVGGTSVPLAPRRAAELLGFVAPIENSVDAVASRDGMLRLLAAAAILGLTLSRLAADLLLWSTEEFGLIQLPDELVGSSSMMPQKRNPFLLEHVKGRGAAALGAFTAAATAMHASPFSNSVAVGTEAARHVAPGLEQTAEAVTLARLVVAGARPVADRMLARAESGLTTATELATRLALDGGLDFRSAHRQVGSLVTRSVATGVPFADVVAGWGERTGHVLPPLDAATVARAARHGGGPGALEGMLPSLLGDWSGRRTRARAQARRWASSATALEAAVQAVGVARKRA